MKKLILTLAVPLALCTAAWGVSQTLSPQSPAEKLIKSYAQMSEAKQAVALEQLAAEFNNAQATGNVSQHHTADIARDMIIATGTYKSVVSPKQMKAAQKVLAQSSADFCRDPAMVELVSYGIGFQAVMQDKAGNIVYESPVCRAHSPAPQMRGSSAAR